VRAQPLPAPLGRHRSRPGPAAPPVPPPCAQGRPGRLPADALHQHGHPLLAAWGKQGRDYINLLDRFDDPGHYRERFAAFGQRIDLFDDEDREAPAHLLGQLQDDILELRPLAETRTAWPPLDPARDASLRFHVAHSAQREVEILHDQLLARFSADPTLRPREIIVMVPDVNAYAPHIQAVFGQYAQDDPRYIPFTLADQGQRGCEPLLIAVEHLLKLPEGRLTVSEVLDLLDVPALRARFKIDESELPTLHRWIEGAGIRWGWTPSGASRSVCRPAWSRTPGASACAACCSATRWGAARPAPASNLTTRSAASTPR